MIDNPTKAADAVKRIRIGKLSAHALAEKSKHIPKWKAQLRKHRSDISRRSARGR